MSGSTGAYAGSSSGVEPSPPVSPMPQVSRYRWTWLLAERAAWALGAVALLTWAALSIDGVTGARKELDRFAALQAAPPQQTATPDLSLWGPERITAWRRALSEPAPSPLAVMRISKINLEVAVLPGTDDFTLNRAVGHIEDTALPGTDGNSGIAGHRDGFFRGLKDIASGDAIELETLRGRRSTASNGPGSSTRRTCPSSTRRRGGRSRWSRATRSTTSVQRRNGTSSAPCVSTTRPRKFSRTAEHVSCVPALVPHRLRLHLITPDWRVAPPVR